VVKTLIKGRDEVFAIVASACCTFLGQVTLTSVLRLMALILLWRSKHVRRRHKTRNSTTETKVNTTECREKLSGLGEAAGTAVRSREGNILAMTVGFKHL